MRVLIVGSAFHASLESSYFRAFDAIGITNLERFNSIEGIDIRRASVLNRIRHNRWTYRFNAWSTAARLVRSLQEDPHYDVIVVFKGLEFSALSIARSRALTPGAVWINVNPDDPFSTENVSSSRTEVVRSIPQFDIYCSYSRRIVAQLRSEGARRAEYLPFGFDPLLHPVAVVRDSTEPSGVVFVGSWDQDRETRLSAIADLGLTIYGNGWENLPTRSPLRACVSLRPLFGIELSTLCGEAAVCLNLLRAQNRGSHNMRTFEIPAVGGLMLTERTEEQAEIFPEGEACLMYESLDEMRAKVEFVLAHPSESRSIRERGAELAAGHAYSSRARDLLKLIESVDANS